MLALSLLAYLIFSGQSAFSGPQFPYLKIEGIGVKCLKGVPEQSINPFI